MTNRVWAKFLGIHRRTAFLTMVGVVLYRYFTEALARVPGDVFDWIHLVAAFMATPVVWMGAWEYSKADRP